MDLKYEEYAEFFHLAFSEDRDDVRFKELIEKYKGLSDNTSIANYVWLPLKFENDMVYIDWYDEWKLEDWE